MDKMKQRLQDIVEQWEIPSAWRDEILSFSEETDFIPKISFLAGTDSPLSIEKIEQRLEKFNVLKEAHAVRANPETAGRTIIVSSFSSCEFDDIAEQAHEYLHKTLQSGFLDIVYPEWGDTPWDLLQLMMALLTPDGNFSVKLWKHNRWPLRGAYTEKIKKMCTALSHLSCNVMITGPSGTGKEAIARLIHAKSLNRGEFIPVSVSTIPKDLFSGVLFGYEKGDFTGAAHKHSGCFEKAGDGTLFLDEIADIEPGQQAALLRALSERQGASIGGARKYPISCRVIAATNKAICAGQGFRPDLRIRLAEQELNCAKDRNDWQPLRPLSLVREQIPLLFAMQYVRCFHEQVGFRVRVKKISFSDRDDDPDMDDRRHEKKVFQRLSEHAWIMNFRELAYVSLNSLLRFIVQESGDVSDIANHDLKIIVKTEPCYDSFSDAESSSGENFSIRDIIGSAPPEAKKWDFLSDFVHREAIDFFKEEYNLSDAECAKRLGVDRSSISRFLRKQGSSY